jgi:large subunit ribosomal protein L29
MKPQEIRNLSTEEVRGRLRDTQEELFNLRFQFTIGQLENHNRLHQLKRDIARLNTILRERELAGDSA